MRAAPFLSGLALVLGALPAPAQAPAYESAVAVPEVEVRSGPSPKFYATGKLRQGDRVTVVAPPTGREAEAGDFVAIKPPPGSFSWVQERFLGDPGRLRVVVGLDVPVRVGSALVGTEPDVEQVKLQRGNVVAIAGQPQVAPDGSKWWPIAPPEREIRYVPKSALNLRPAVQTAAAPPPGAPPVAAAVTEPLWQQAEQAERAGDSKQAEELYARLANQPATPHELKVRCLNRIDFLRSGNRGSVPPGYQSGQPTSAYYGGDNRLAPTPAGGQPLPPPVFATSRTPAATPAAPPPVQSSGPGWLHRAPFTIDHKQAYVFEPGGGRLRMYVTAVPGLNLEPYVNRVVDLQGSVVYHGELRTNYMTVARVALLR